MKVGQIEIPCENEDKCHLTISSSGPSIGSFEAPESITNDEVACIVINDPSAELQVYKVEIDGFEIKNAYFENDCINFFIDVDIHPGKYDINISKKVNDQYIPLENTGGQTYIFVTLLPSYTVDS